MKKNWMILIFVGASLLLLLYVKVSSIDVANDTASETQNNTPATTSESVTSQTTEPNPYDIPQPDDPRLTRLADGRVLYNPSVEASRTLDQTIDPDEALTVIDQLISHYRFAYKENPVGSENTEITEQLLGKNPKRIVFLDPQSQALKDKQLLDQWGTPYFFHALSAQEMEIRSAGPDQQHWTADDFAINQAQQDSE
ncbi:MAG: hypothetical protein ACSHX4_00505 [Opitutaceae bacterium]